MDDSLGRVIQTSTGGIAVPLPVARRRINWRALLRKLKPPRPPVMLIFYGALSVFYTVMSVYEFSHGEIFVSCADVAWAALFTRWAWLEWRGMLDRMRRGDLPALWSAAPRWGLFDVIYWITLMAAGNAFFVAAIFT